MKFAYAIKKLSLQIWNLVWKISRKTFFLFKCCSRHVNCNFDNTRFFEKKTSSKKIKQWKIVHKKNNCKYKSLAFFCFLVSIFSLIWLKGTYDIKKVKTVCAMIHECRKCKTYRNRCMLKVTFLQKNIVHYFHHDLKRQCLTWERLFN